MLPARARNLTCLAPSPLFWNTPDQSPTVFFFFNFLLLQLRHESTYR